MIPDDVKRAIEQKLRNHFEAELAANFRRFGVYQRMSPSDFARAVNEEVDEVVQRCLPVYLEDASVGAARGLPTVETEIEDPQAKGMSAREVRELVASAVKAASRHPAVKVKEIPTKRNADGSTSATIREREG